MIMNKYSGRILKSWKNREGYLVVRLGAKGKNQLVHRLVAYAFVPMEFGKDIVNHKNGIRDDNRAENLEWCDKSYNYHHAVKTGLCSGHPNLGHTNSIGSKNVKSKLTEQDVINIRLHRERGLTLKQISDIFEVSLSTIGYIIQRKTWRHV